MAEFRTRHSDCERMLHLRAHTFAPLTPRLAYRIDIARKSPNVPQTLQLNFYPLAPIGPVSPKSGSAKTRTYRTTTAYRGGKKCETQL